MQCVLLVRHRNEPHPDLKRIIPDKPTGRAKPLAWGPADQTSHNLYLLDIDEVDLPVATELAQPTGNLFPLLEGATVETLLAGFGLRPL